MAQAIDIARYLIQLAALEDEPELLTHLRLQKLLYYVQGWSLAFRSGPMFPETIEAWKFGPVIRDVYPHFADFGHDPIPASAAGGTIPLAEDQKSFVASIWEGYKRYSAIALSEKTHCETPWRDAYARRHAPDRCEEVISHDALRRFFLEEHRRRAQPYIDPARVKQAEEDVRAGHILSLDEVKRGLGDAV